MLDNTIIIFTSDNGGPANGLNMNWATNYPLRGAKTTVFEGIRLLIFLLVNIFSPAFLVSFNFFSQPKLSRRFVFSLLYLLWSIIIILNIYPG